MLTDVDMTLLIVIRNLIEVIQDGIACSLELSRDHEIDRPASNLCDCIIRVSGLERLVSVAKYRK